MIQETEIILPINGINWKIIKCDIDFTSNEIAIAFKQAKLKSQFTMNASQSGAYRSPEMKYNMQLMGLVAEVGCKKYLEKLLIENDLNNTWSVIRYDDVRTDGFKSAKNEFDIKILNNADPSKFILVESRSSITYDRSLVDGIKFFDIIGPYSSVAKSKEAGNDIYLRPLYEYLDYSKVKYSKLNFERLLKDRKVILYIVAGCTFDEMKKNGFYKNMMQGSTQYLVLPILKGHDTFEFKNKILELIQNFT